MNFIEYRGKEMGFDLGRVSVSEVRSRFGISGRKAMFVATGKGLTRHIPDYIDFRKDEKVIIEAISDFKLG